MNWLPVIPPAIPPSTASSAKSSSPKRLPTGGTATLRADSTSSEPQEVISWVSQSFFEPIVSVSGDGTKIAFDSNADLKPGLNQDGFSEIFVINADGTGLRQLTNSPRYVDSHSPVLSSCGDWLAFLKGSIGEGEAGFAIDTINSNGTNLREIVSSGSSGHSIAPVIGKIAFSSYENFSGENPNNDLEIFIINRDGNGLKQLTNFRDACCDYFVGTSISNDGRKVVFESPQYDDHTVYIANSDGSALQRLVNGFSPLISGDGSRVVFKSFANLIGQNPDGSQELFIINVDGTGLRQLTNSTSGDLFSPSISFDGSKVAFASSADLLRENPDGNLEIFVVNSDGTGLRQITNSTSGYNLNPAISADGSKVAFASTPDSSDSGSSQRWRIMLATLAPLVFPVRGCTPWTAPISSVFDHSMQRAYGNQSFGGYGKVIAFTGEEGSGNRDGCSGGGACGCLYGYINPTRDLFIVNGSYAGVTSCGGRSYLEYDNHPGIDYAFGYGTAVYPAISGRVHYFNPPSGTTNAQSFHTLQIDPEDGSGYKVYHLHLSTYPDPSDPSGQRILRRLQDGTVTVCNECAKENEWVDVNRSNSIAYTGNYLNGWGTVGNHLHFEVQKNGVPVDPYGWDVCGMKDPYDDIMGTTGINVQLWRDPRLNAQGSIDQRPTARFMMRAPTGQIANENEVLRSTVSPGGTIGVTFDPSLSLDPDGRIEAYRWYINGVLQSQAQPGTRIFSHSFGEGRFDIVLVVQDERGATGTAGGIIIITPTSGRVTIVSEDFEGPFPTGNWRVFDNDGTTNGEYYWGKDSHRSNTGQWSAYCVRGGRNGRSAPGPYPNNAKSWMVYNGPRKLDR
jgi:TolB protein